MTRQDCPAIIAGLRGERGPPGSPHSAAPGPDRGARRARGDRRDRQGGGPDLFAWSAGSTGAAAAALTRSALIVPQPAETDEAVEAARARLRERTTALRRSVHVRHVDAGSDGSEEWEIQALLGPVYDIHRLGVFFTASPRHADVLLVTGAGARGMAEPLRATHDAMPDPKVVIAAGTDAVSGGLLSQSEATTAGVAATVPVDVWLPGSPPSPFGIIKALLIAVGKLADGGRRTP